MKNGMLPWYREIPRYNCIYCSIQKFGAISINRNDKDINKTPQNVCVISHIPLPNAFKYTDAVGVDAEEEEWWD